MPITSLLSPMRKNRLGRIAGALLLVVLGLTVWGCGSSNSTPTAAPIKIDFFSTQDGLPSEQVTAMAVLGHQIWIGTKKGLGTYDGVNWQIISGKNNKSLGSDIIEALFAAANGLYVATERGVTRYDGTNWASVFTGSRARGVSAKPPEIAIATAHGVEKSTGGAFQAYSKEAGLINEEVNTVAYDAKGRLWAGTRAGMAAFEGMRFQNFTGPQKTVMGTSLIDVPPSPANCQLIGNNINVIIPFKGMIAVGTTSGLSITDMENQWQSYTADHKDWFQRAGKIVEELVTGNSKLPGNSITALATMASDSVLIVGTNKGVTALKDSVWIDLHAQIPSLRPGPITGLAVQGDKLWIGTPGGVFRISDAGRLLGLTQ